jgi:hypothetical protein
LELLFELLFELLLELVELLANGAADFLDASHGLGRP